MATATTGRKIVLILWNKRIRNKSALKEQKSFLDVAEVYQLGTRYTMIIIAKESSGILEYLSAFKGTQTVSKKY